MIYFNRNIFREQYTDLGGNNNEELIPREERVETDNTSAEKLANDENLQRKTDQYVQSERAMKKAMSIIDNPEKLEETLRRTEEKMNRVDGVFVQFRDNVQTLLRMIKAFKNGLYKEFPTKTMVVAVIGIIYFVNPFDFVPDLIPILGQIDDMMVISYIFLSLGKDIENFRNWELVFNDELDNDMEIKTKKSEK